MYESTTADELVVDDEIMTPEGNLPIKGVVSALTEFPDGIRLVVNDDQAYEVAPDYHFLVLKPDPPDKSEDKSDTPDTESDPSPAATSPDSAV